MDQSQRLALAEMDERLEQIFAAIEVLRASAANGKTRRASLEALFRLVHSAKGSASATGLDHLGQIAHELEGLLHAIRIGKASLDERCSNSRSNGPGHVGGLYAVAPPYGQHSLLRMTATGLGSAISIKVAQLEAVSCSSF